MSKESTSKDVAYARKAGVNVLMNQNDRLRRLTRISINLL